jgi:hypothetical protein
MSYSAPSGYGSPLTSKSGYNVRQVSNYTPEMMKLFQGLVGKAQPGATQGLDYLSKLAGGDEAAFAQSEAPAYSAYNKALGQLGSRFASVGALNSSAFQNAGAGAAQSLAENLQSRRSDIQQNAIRSLLDYSGQLLGQRPYENLLEEEGGFDWAGLLGGLGGTALGSFLGPFGSAIGGGLGQKFASQLFG